MTSQHPIRILYIQHSALGGSVYSLAYLIEGIDRGKYEPIVACIVDSPYLLENYKNRGIETFHWPGISDFRHTTLGWYPLYNPLSVGQLFKSLIGFLPSIYATKRLIAEFQPDIVHLNSLVLSPSAIAAARAEIPLIWHIREPVHPGHWGIRKWILGQLVGRLADEVIFISDYDKQVLLNDRKGLVVHNFVDFEHFDRNIEASLVRKEIGLAPEDKVILFLGGQSVVKGIFPLLDSIPIVKTSVPEAHFIIGAGQHQPSGRLSSKIARSILPLIGTGTVSQRVNRVLDRNNMRDYVHLLPWREDVERLIAASDVIVFPSISPHFARPVIEAGAMAKPVVASRIGGVEELVKDGETGILVEPRNSQELAAGLIRLLTDAEEARRMGEAGFQLARREYNACDKVNEVLRLYDHLSIHKGG